MNNSIKDQIKKSGLKKVFIAEKIGLSPSHFSQVLRGTRNLTLEKEIALKDLISKAS
jgi:antitoxin component HigA of HigAB toxin-antitoxin module